MSEEYNLVHLALVGETLLANAGYLDDLDEIVADHLEEVMKGKMSVDDLFEWSFGVDELVRLINDHSEHKLTVDCLKEIQEQVAELDQSNPYIQDIIERTGE